MNVINRIMKRLQDKRLWAKKNVCDDNRYAIGFVDGLDAAESIVYDEQEKTNRWAARNIERLWKTGAPTETGDYILIMKANFDSDDVVKDKIYIATDFWSDDGWDSFETGEDSWEVLYFAKLSNIRFQLPAGLGIQRSSDMFLK